MLGLCGPSELARNDHPLYLERVRSDTIPADRLPPARQAPTATPTGQALAAALKRGLLRKLPRERRFVSQLVRQDLVDHVMSFLTDDVFTSRTANGALNFATTRSHLLDFFFQAVPKASPCQSSERLEELVAGAWAENPRVAMQLVFHLGAARSGKQDRWGFYDALVWVWKMSPGTVLVNLAHVPDTNYWKALLEFAVRVAEGPERTRERAVVQHAAHKAKRPMLLQRDKPGYTGYKDCEYGWDGAGSRLENARGVLKRYDSDPLFRALLHKVAALFAAQIQADLVAMADPALGVSLCAKWAPYPYHGYDRRTLLAELIARELFPRSLEEYAGIEERDYAYRVRERYRHVLTRLREHKRVPERLLNAGRVQEISYTTVPGACLARNAKKFMQLDKDRFLRFLGSKQGKKCGALQPHELVNKVESTLGFEAILAYEQWNALVAQTKAAGIQNCIAVCDVSGSMGCEAAPGVRCMDVAVALTLLLAELEGFGHQRAITFHSRPQLVQLRAGATLREHARQVKAMDWGMSTDFNKVFDLLIDTDVERVFVFSDMQFDQAGGSRTNFEAARSLYAARGKQLPEMVFWNLRAGGRGAPVQADTRGAVLVSGFSAALLQDVLAVKAEEPEEESAPAEQKAKKAPKSERTPMEVMCCALDKPVFAAVAVASDDRAVVEAILGTRCSLGPALGSLRPARPASSSPPYTKKQLREIEQEMEEVEYADEMEYASWQPSVVRISAYYQEPVRGKMHYPRALRLTKRRGCVLPRRARLHKATGARAQYRLADTRRRILKARGVTRRTNADVKYDCA